MRLIDWRAADASLVGGCYAREAEYWRDTLRWDTTSTWSVVEEARRTWGLPGFIVVDRKDSVRGWTFVHRADEAVHIGALVADDEVATHLLVGAIDQHAGECLAGTTMGLVPRRAAGVDPLLRGAGFVTEPYLYLSRPLELGDALEGVNTEEWSPPQFPDAVSLLRSAYDKKAGSLFAPTGTDNEWASYLEGLIDRDGCGAFDPGASRVVRDDRGIAGVILVSTISGDTAHVTQLAVRPDARGNGVAVRLIRDALGRAAARGRRAVTLLVSAENVPARTLYHRAGFRGDAAFIAARRQAKPVKMFSQ